VSAKPGAALSETTRPLAPGHNKGRQQPSLRIKPTTRLRGGREDGLAGAVAKLEGARPGALRHLGEYEQPSVRAWDPGRVR
jgi:hypothetical protein